jgi:hypothetical protein
VDVATDLDGCLELEQRRLVHENLCRLVDQVRHLVACEGDRGARLLCGAQGCGSLFVVRTGVPGAFKRQYGWRPSDPCARPSEEGGVCVLGRRWGLGFSDISEADALSLTARSLAIMPSTFELSVMIPISRRRTKNLDPTRRRRATREREGAERDAEPTRCRCRGLKKGPERARGRPPTPRPPAPPPRAPPLVTRQFGGKGRGDSRTAEKIWTEAHSACYQGSGFLVRPPPCPCLAARRNAYPARATAAVFSRAPPGPSKLQPCQHKPR